MIPTAIFVFCAVLIAALVRDALTIRDLRLRNATLTASLAGANAEISRCHAIIERYNVEHIFEAIEESGIEGSRA